MPADEVVVTDTSPLLNLDLIDRLDLLEAQFDAVEAPEQVWRELTRGEERLSDLTALRERGFLRVVPVERTDLSVEIGRELDDGETAAITYAIERGADLVLLDERDGRHVARRHDLDVTGVIGILLRGERADMVDLESELDALRDEGFWISDELYQDTLETGDEGTE